MHLRIMIPARQFALFRVVFGLYLAWHCGALLPWGGELFGRGGTIPDASLNLTYPLFPNPLYRWDSEIAVQALLASMVALAICFAAGIGRRVAAIGLWFGWTCLFHRNNLISNPSLPYVGLLLLLTVLVPLGEGWTLRRREASADWHFPRAVYLVAWTLMALGYTYSGWAKLMSPSWADGSALSHLLHNPLSRVGAPADWLRSLPPLPLRLATWSTLAIELLAVPASFHRTARGIIWSALVLLHLGILSAVDFADLTAGMLMVHVFTFDPDWIPRRWRS